MKRIGLWFLLLVSLSACGSNAVDDSSCNWEGDLCVSLLVDGPIQFGQPITVRITVTSTQDITGLAIYLFAYPSILIEDSEGWVENGIHWEINLEANQPETFYKRIQLPENNAFYTIISDAHTPQKSADDSLIIYQKDGVLTVYYPNTPIPVTSGPLPSTDPNVVATLRALPSNTPWPAITPYPTNTAEIIPTPYPPPPTDVWRNPYP